MTEVDFFNEFFEGKKNIYKLVGIMEFYRYRYKICKIRINKEAPPTICILFPLDEDTIPFLLDILTKCKIDYSTSYRIDTPNFVIHRSRTFTINTKQGDRVSIRYSTLLAKGHYQTILEEKNEKK